MEKILSNKLKEVKESIEYLTAEKVETAWALSIYKKLDIAYKRYENAKYASNRDVKTIMQLSLEILFLVCFYFGLSIPLNIVSVISFGALGVLLTISLGIFVKDLRRQEIEREYLKENGYDPKDEEMMEYIANKSLEYHDKFVRTSSDLEELEHMKDELVDLESINDFNSISNNYPELYREYLERQFADYLQEIQQEDVKDFHFDVSKEELKRGLKSYKLK